MDPVAVPEGVVGQVVQQISVALPLGPEVLQRRLPGHEGELRHVVHLGQPGLEGPGLLLVEAVVYVDQHLVLVLQVSQHVVQIHRQQSEGTHDNQAGHDHTHRGEGHEAVGKDGVEALADVVSRVKFSRHCSNHLSRR